MNGEFVDLKTIIAGSCFAIAVISDLRTKKIPNKLVWGFALLSVVSVLVIDRLSGLWIMGSGLLAAVLFVLPIYLLKAIGGGDFKLVLAISPLLTWQATLTTVVASLFWGALLGLITIVLKGQLKSFAANMQTIATRVRPDQSQLNTMPFSVALLFGYLTFLGLASAGVSIL